MSTAALEETQAVTVRANGNGAVKLTDQDIQTLVSVGSIPQGTPPDVIAFFGRVCAETRMSPFKRQVHLIKRWSKQGDRYTVQTGIDGYRAQADRTGRYAGSDEYLFDEGLREYDMVKAKRKPVTATVTVYKAVSGMRCPFTATARWEEYYPGDKQGFMWDKMPFLMLGKCAEALALRKAFPDELAGIYTDAEMAQADMKDVPKSEYVAPPQSAPQVSSSQPQQQKQPANAEPEDDLPFEAAADAPPSTTTVVAPSAKVATNVQRDRMVSQLIADFGEQGQLLDYAQKAGILLSTETLLEWPLRYVPATEAQYKLLKATIKDFLDGEPAQKAFTNAEPSPEKQAKAETVKEPVKDEPWRKFPVPFGKHKGVLLGDLEKNTLYGFWAGFEVKPTFEGRDGKPVQKSATSLAKDKEFRAALDAAGATYTFTRKE